METDFTQGKLTIDFKKLLVMTQNSSPHEPFSSSVLCAIFRCVSLLSTALLTTCVFMNALEGLSKPSLVFCFVLSHTSEILVPI